MDYYLINKSLIIQIRKVVLPNDDSSSRISFILTEGELFRIMILILKN